jgi:hypothetical protein
MMDKHTGLAAPQFWIQDSSSRSGSRRYKPDDSATTTAASAADQVTKNLYVNVFEVYADGRTKRNKFIFHF